MARRSHPAERALPVVAGLLAVASGVAVLWRRARPMRSSGRGALSTPPDARTVAAGFETTDMSVRLVGRILAGFGGIVFGSIALLFLMIHVFHRENAPQPALTAQQDAVIVPPKPNLQADPVRELQDLLAREHARLTEYAWADDAHTKARIPIARAMQLVTGRSLEPAP